ncbi:MAG TPA: phosphomannomutase [Nevskiales bacterium]|nr:phosphomannomutase [Nevskiales bacterium]
MGKHYSFFKAYDVRGRVPEELNPDIAWRIARAYAEFIQPDSVVLGRDMRLSSAALCDALAQGLAEAGVNVIDIGLCGTEEVYFATFDRGAGGGIMVTASHNPANYNGLKFVREGARPLSSDSGLTEIETLAATRDFPRQPARGRRTQADTRPDYVRWLLGQVDVAVLKPLRIVVDAGNGCAGLVVDALEARLPFEFVKLHHQPDGTFPNGVPNPLLPQNRAATARAVTEHCADFGIAWDGDFDRCFLFDEQGRFIEGYYIVGLIAQALLAAHPGEKIVHDPRLVWNTVDVVQAAGGVPVQTKAGHAFIKERMRAENAIYGGEMSAHHYFRDFAYCDNGTLPWLLVAQLLSVSGCRLSELVEDRIRRFPASGEINREIADPDAALAAAEARYAPSAKSVEHVDGLSVDCGDWRFNLRKSNTEPVVRLNVEARGDAALMQAKTRELLGLLASLGAKEAL